MIQLGSIDMSVQFQALIMQSFSDSVLGAKRAFLSSVGLEDDVVF